MHGEMHGDRANEVLDMLAAKIDAFALTLSAPEQVLLAELINGGVHSPVAGFGSRPIWPGLTTLISSSQLQFVVEGAEAAQRTPIRNRLIDGLPDTAEE